MTHTLSFAAHKLKGIFRSIENFSAVVYGSPLKEVGPYMILQAVDNLGTASAVEDLW
jgi:hypothetical protein